MINKPTKIIVHHEAPAVLSNFLRFALVNEYHKERFNAKSSLGFYCGYQYFIEKSGYVIQARLDTDEGAHTIGHNLSSIGICLAGNFDLEMPTEAQKTALRTLLRDLTLKYYILPSEIVPHRKFAPKSCYGSKLSDTWARDLLTGEEKINLLRSVLNALFATLKKLSGK